MSEQTSQFKVGDRVKTTRTVMGAPAGSLATVEGVLPDVPGEDRQYPYQVALDVDGLRLCYAEDELESTEEPDSNTLVLSEGEAEVLRRLLERLVGDD